MHPSSPPAPLASRLVLVGNASVLHTRARTCMCVLVGWLVCRHLLRLGRRLERPAAAMVQHVQHTHCSVDKQTRDARTHAPFTQHLLCRRPLPMKARHAEQERVCVLLRQRPLSCPPPSMATTSTVLMVVVAATALQVALELQSVRCCHRQCQALSGSPINSFNSNDTYHLASTATAAALIRSKRASANHFTHLVFHSLIRSSSPHSEHPQLRLLTTTTD